MNVKLLTGLFICAFLTSCLQKKENAQVIVSSSSYFQLANEKTYLKEWSKSNILHAHLSTEPDNLHPVNGSSSPRSELFNYIHKTVLAIDKKTEQLIPVLCDRLPEEAPDGKHYSFQLSKNIRWDDQQLLTADDIIFTAKVNKCLLTSNPSLQPYWNNLLSIKKGNDPFSFTLELKEKTIQSIYFLSSFPIIQRARYDSLDVFSKITFEQLDDTNFYHAVPDELKAFANQFNDPVNGHDPSRISGLGDYKIAKWQSGEFIQLIKKDKSNHTSPEQLVFHFIKDDNALLLSLRNGNIDYTSGITIQNFFNISSDSLQRKNFSALLMPTYNYTFIALNEKPLASNRKAYFNELKTRRAIALLTPVDQILSALYHAYGKDCKRMVSNVSPLKKEFNTELKPLQFDLQRAKNLLNAAGWKINRDGILQNNQGDLFQPELIYLNNSSDWKDMAMLIADAYKKAGIFVQLTPADINVFLTRARAHDFDMILGSWNGSQQPEDFTQLWHSSSWKNNGSNYPGFGNRESDLLIDSMRIETDLNKRLKMSHRLQQMVYDDQPMVFLYCNLRRNIIHKRFANRNFFAERPGIFLNELRLLTMEQGILQETGVNP